MNETAAIALLLLFVINLGIVVGAGFYELRVVVPVWASAPPRSLLVPESGLRFWALVTTGPLTVLTLANAVAAWQASDPVRTWWLAAVIIIAIERVATFGYFVPTMVRLQRDQSAAPEIVKTKFARWAALNYPRNVASLIAWLVAMKSVGDARPLTVAATLERDDFSSNRHPTLAYCWSMIFSENRHPLFGIML
jgi:hypothetical protein